MSRRNALKAAQALMGEDVSAAMSRPVFAGFDYTAVVSEADAALMRDAAEQVRTIVKASAIEIGRILLRVKADVWHGYFMNWCSAEFDFSARTVNHFMTAARLAGEFAQCANFPAPILNAVARAPEPMQQDLIKRVSAGDIVSPSGVRAAVKLAREPEDNETRGQRAEEGYELYARIGLYAAREVERASLAAVVEMRRFVAKIPKDEDG